MNLNRGANNLKRALIIVNGEINDYDYYKNYINDDDFIICADGGIKHLNAIGVTPDVFVGDFDSSSPDQLIGDVEIQKHNPIKNYTDTKLAIDIAFEKGYGNIEILGGLGGRVDHLLANVFLLKYIHENGGVGKIVDEKNMVMLLTDTITLNKENNSFVSLVPLTPTVEGITNKGLIYPLNDFCMRFGSTRGISNEFADDSAEITIKKGEALVIISKE